MSERKEMKKQKFYIIFSRAHDKKIDAENELKSLPKKLRNNFAIGEAKVTFEFNKQKEVKKWRLKILKSM